MAPAQNDTFDFFMAETTCSDAPSDTEDSNLDSLLHQFKSPSYQENQQCLSDACNVSDTAEGYDLMCDQSSSHFTIEDNVSRSVATTLTSGGEMSPGYSSVFNVGQSPLSTSGASVAATAGTHCDLNWPNVTDDESVTEVCIQPNKGEKRKVSPWSSPLPRRQAIRGYQSMTPWTNDNLVTHGSIPSPNPEIPCFPLDSQMLQEEKESRQIPMPSSSCMPESRPVHSSAVTETVYSLTSSASSMSAQGMAHCQSLKRSPDQSVDSLQITREKRFRKTAEALQKCGLWDIAMKTGNLIKLNAELQKEIDRFREEATVFLKAVVQNPENKELMESLSKGVPLTLSRKAPVVDGFVSDAATKVTTTRIRSRVFDSSSSTTSGYTSYTDGGSKLSNTLHK